MAGKAADWLSFPFGLVWWREMKTNFPAELAADIDAALGERDPSYLQRQFAGMKKALLELPEAEASRQRGGGDR